MKPQKPKRDPTRIYVQAERFLFSEERLRSPANMESPAVGAYIALPALVLSAFAAELYLKCLICIEGDSVPPTHNLKNLFARLNGKTQRRLEEMWTASLPSREAMFEFAEREFGYTAARDLRSALADGGSAFEQLRYVHEGEPKTKYYLADFPRMIRKVIWEQRPDLKGIGPSFHPVGPQDR